MMTTAWAVPSGSCGLVCAVSCIGAGSLARGQGRECAAVAVVGGDPAVVLRVRSWLDAHGVADRAAEDCGGVVATVSPTAGPDGHGILVERLEPSGRSDSRVVLSVETAAMLIESWANRDLLEPTSPPPGPPPEVATQVIEPRATEEPSAEPGPGDPGNTLARISVEGGAAIASDGSLWVVPSLRWCVQLGPVCVGAAVRGVIDAGVTGRSAQLGTSRLGLDAVASGEIPLDVGSLTLSPGIGVGAGWLRYSAGSVGPAGDMLVELDRGDLRVDAFLHAYVSVARPLGFEASLSVAIAPLAASADIHDDGVVLAAFPVFRLELSVGLVLEVSK